MEYKIRDIISFLDQLAPPAYQESYDNARLIAGDPDQPVKGILCSLDCTEEVIEEAVQLGVNLVVAHHPIVFKGLKSLTGKKLRGANYHQSNQKRCRDFRHSYQS